MNTNDLNLFIGKTPKKLKDVRPGVCIDEDGYIIFKTEYSKERNGEYFPECYNEAGECYGGDYDTLVYTISKVKTIARTRKLELYQGTDQMGRGFVAGKSCSGKSMCLKGIAITNDYRYIGEESTQFFTFPMTCQDLLDTLSLSGEVNGIVLDFPMVHEKLTDFRDYKWNIPVWYSLQLKRDGSFRFEDITKYKLDLRD